MKYIVLVVCLLLVSLAAGYWQDTTRPPATAQTGYGKAAIGGAFTLNDTNGTAFSDTNLKGHFSLIYFGFTHCPDICPTSLLNITHALEQLGAQGDDIMPVFVTLDPERDTQQVLHEYISHFHPRMVGLTGTAEQTKQIADAYKVYYSKTSLENSALSYTINHTGYIYLMDKNGEYLAHFAHDISDQALAQKISALIAH